MSPNAVLAVGVIITAVSLFLNIARDTRKFSLFLLAGIAMVAYAFARIFILGHERGAPPASRAPRAAAGAQGFRRHRAQSFNSAFRGAQRMCQRCGNLLRPEDRYCSLCG